MSMHRKYIKDPDEFIVLIHQSDLFRRYMDKDVWGAQAYELIGTCFYFLFYYAPNGVYQYQFVAWKMPSQQQGLSEADVTFEFVLDNSPKEIQEKLVFLLGEFA